MEGWVVQAKFQGSNRVSWSINYHFSVHHVKAWDFPVVIPVFLSLLVDHLSGHCAIGNSPGFSERTINLKNSVHAVL